MDRNKLLEIVVGAVFGLVLTLVVQSVIDGANAAPAMVFQKAVVSPKFTDVFFKSESSHPFVIHGYSYRVLQVVREAPPLVQPEPQAIPQAPRQPRQRRRWLDRNLAGAPISPDDITLRPGPVVLNCWIQGESDSFTVAPNDAERLRVRIIDPERAGARYLIDAFVAYGDPQKPKWVQTPPFEVEVVAEWDGSALGE